MDKIFAPFPERREQPSSAEGGAGCFVPASGRDKDIHSILLILSNFYWVGQLLPASQSIVILQHRF